MTTADVVGTAVGLPESNTGHLLVIDDSNLNRKKLSLLLQQQGHSVSLAEDGKCGLDLLKREPVDLVLLDIVMPEMDGYEVLQRMKQDPDLRDVPVIVISAVEDISSVVRCIEMGAEDYLPKQFDPVILRARIQASLQRKRVRDLEKLLLNQELALRQNEKLATLGRLSAGLAHELNNPAAAVRRGASVIQETLPQFQQAQRAMLEMQPSTSQQRLLAELEGKPLGNDSEISLDALARSDRQFELETWLTSRDIQEPWLLAPVLLELNLDESQLESLESEFGRDDLTNAVEWLHQLQTLRSLAFEVLEGATRLSEIVQALKSYSYMDRAPVQDVDIRQGLNNTLIILRNKLKRGIEVTREFDPELPVIEAYGSELNQVWTNLIDNASDAMQGAGHLILRTGRNGEGIEVEIEDNGSGIPEDVVGSIFDPFFTTKAPGSGTGLGLSISHNIIANRHHGKISVDSQPGKTVFRIWLPLRLADHEE